MTQNLIYKSFDIQLLEEGQFVGIASTQIVDRHNDLVITKGLTYDLPLPLLLEHSNNNKIGFITKAYFTMQDGVDSLTIEGNIELNNTSSELVDLKKRIAIRELAKKGYYGFSIGFYPLSTKTLANGVNEISAGKIMEISLVKTPANEAATLLKIKSEDSILNEGMELLRKFYEEKNKIDNEYKQQIKKSLEEKMKNTIKLTEFSNSIKQCYNLTTKDTDSIIHETKMFYKRCDEHYNKKQINKADDNVKQDAYSWLAINLKK
jgi:phage head maturation protease